MRSDPESYFNFTENNASQRIYPAYIPYQAQNNIDPNLLMVLGLCAIIVLGGIIIIGMRK